MTTVAIWILVSVSWSTGNYGTATVIERFATKEDCVSVEKSLPLRGAVDAKCIQAKVIKP